MMQLTFALSVLLAAPAAARIRYVGINESGGEFGVYSTAAIKGTGLPGTFGVDYAFLNQSTLPTWLGKNHINTFRVAFLLERMCPLEYGLGKKFNETYFGEFDDAIQAITSHGGYAIFDPHNYMRYNDPSQQPMTGSIIGNTSDPNAATTAQFQAFWKELAGRYVHNERVIFGIMNEPHDMPTSLVLTNDQAAINGIRSAGAKQLILAPGNGYTGGHVWNASSQGDEPSADYLYKLHDPAKNTAIDIHEYLDYDFSGSHLVCNQSFPSNMYGLTKWLRQHDLKAFVTEFGGDNNTMCNNYLREAVHHMAKNDEYIGWLAWAAGPLWGTSSPCCTDGRQYGSLEPGSKAADGGPSLYDTVWLPVLEPLVPRNLQRNGISSVHGQRSSYVTSMKFLPLALGTTT